jgi:hypothetical protein
MFLGYLFKEVCFYGDSIQWSPFRLSTVSMWNWCLFQGLSPPVIRNWCDEYYVHTLYTQSSYLTQLIRVGGLRWSLLSCPSWDQWGTVMRYLKSCCHPVCSKMSVASVTKQSMCAVILAIVHSRRRDSVNKASPVSSQLTARSGQSAHLVQCTRCIWTHFNLHLDFGHPCKGTLITWSLHDFILRGKEISRAFYDDSLVSANGL